MPSALVVVLLTVYLASYLVLSRRGYREADAWNMNSFYYFTPEDTDIWRHTNFGCVLLFSPLNLIDRALGIGRPPASEPLWRLSKFDKRKRSVDSFELA